LEIGALSPVDTLRQKHDEIVMSNSARKSETKQRQRAIRAAEGYLELMSIHGHGLEINVEFAQPLADRVIAIVDNVEFPRGHQAYLLYLAGEACRIARRFRDAITWYQQTLEVEPDNVHCLLAIAWCYKRTDQLEDAIEAMHVAIEYEPDQAICHYNLACYLALQGQANGAITFLAQAFELQPDYRQMVEHEPDFDSIRDDDAFSEFLSPVV